MALVSDEFILIRIGFPIEIVGLNGDFADKGTSSKTKKLV